MTDQTFEGFRPEEDAKLQQLINLAKEYEPSQIVELGDNHILVAIPWQSTAEKASYPATDDEIRYKDITQVDPQYILQAIALAKVFEPAIDKDLRLDTEKALKIIKADPTLGLVGTLNTTVKEGSNKVSVVVDKVFDLLLKVFQLVATPELHTALTAAATNTFTNLKTQKDNNWIVWTEKHESKTTYEYGITFAVQNTKTGAVMLALPISFEITADKNYEELLGITLRDTASYEVLIKAIRVAQPLKK